MATWRDENENTDYSLRQVLKKIEHIHNKPTFSMWNEYSLSDHDVEQEPEDL